jgi:hypothetical protein
MSNKNYLFEKILKEKIYRKDFERKIYRKDFVCDVWSIKTSS